MTRTLKTWHGVAAGLLLAWPATAQDEAKTQELTAQQIVERANQVSYYQGKDGRAQVAMKIVDGQGRERSREMTILRRDEPAPEEWLKTHEDPETYCKDQSFYVVFHRPADVNKTAFLVLKHPGQDDDRWLYLPALDLVKRISAADKRTSFVGSDFYYEDVSGRHVEADTHTLAETSQNYYVIESTPKDPKTVEFARYKTWIHRTTFLVVKSESYDEKGDVQRRYEAKKVETIQGKPTTTIARMSDLRTGGYTETTYTNVVYDLDLPADIFTERYLKRPPRSYLK
ncbi:MAG: outer membrane lipoprotein-sorting protein [Planctomycetes bacterium]|nr:outer membrane lipoprotein-sorting protein [Planctomycetota bacterium]